VLKTVECEDDAVVMIDQRRLPAEEVYLRCRDHRTVAAAIKDMAIRGAPAIGVAAALGIALGVRKSKSEGKDLRREFEGICEDLRVTRPTAVNLFWAIDRMTPTAGYGTALGVIRSAARDGNIRGVIAGETRPYLQGARLTTWELMHDGIPTTLIADNMAGHMMATGQVDLVMVGADRIAGNGDVANKIGTYGLGVLARENGVPFYVAAPVSTFDLSIPSGDRIPIEERAAEEVTHHGGRRLAAEGVSVRNPAFDVTPHRFVTAIICERGVARPPYTESLRRMADAR